MLWNVNLIMRLLGSGIVTKSKQLGLRNFVVKFLVYTATFAYQLLLFSSMDTSFFVYWSIISLACGFIGMLDLGYANTISLRHLDQLGNRIKLRSEPAAILGFLRTSPRQFLQAIAAAFCAGLCLVLATSSLVFGSDSLHLSIMATSVVVLLANYVGSLLSQFSIATGSASEVLVCQLVGSTIQLCVALLSRDIFVNLIFLASTPVLLVATWSIKFFKIPSREFGTYSDSNIKSSKLNFKLQSIQILGILTTLTVQFLPLRIYSIEEVSSLQLQLKISYSVVALVATLYISAIREARILTWNQYAKRFLLFTFLSITFSSLIFITVGILSSLGKTTQLSTTIFTTFLFIVYIGLQPLSQGLFFFILVQKEYSVILWAAISHFASQSVLILATGFLLGPTSIPLAMCLSAIISMIPMIKYIRSLQRQG